MSRAKAFKNRFFVLHSVNCTDYTDEKLLKYRHKVIFLQIFSAKKITFYGKKHQFFVHNDKNMLNNILLLLHFYT